MPSLGLFSSSAASAREPPMSAQGGQDSGQTPVNSAAPSQSTLTSPANARLSGIPITPLAQQAPQPPPPEPFSELDNPDAIALRSTISILQIQREQSKVDLRKLEQLKHEAVANAEAYKDELITGRIRSGPGSRKHFGSELGSVAPRPSRRSAMEDDEDEVMKDVDEDSDSEGEEDEEDGHPPSQFGEVPTPQNVVRCPPVNWDKYHVVGESLDKIHAEQQLRPPQGQAQQDGNARVPASRPPESLIAAPYRPLVDKLPPEPMRTRSGGKRS